MTLQAKTTAKFTLCSLCGLLVLGAFQGCEDAAAKQRDEVQRNIREASRDLQMAMATSGVTGVESDDDLHSKQQKLSGIISKLSAGGSGGEPGQNAAKSLLSASAQRELANIRLSQAARIEAAHQEMRNQMREKVDAVQSMNALASGIESADAKAEREQLETLLEGARNRATELAEKITQLDGPINEQSSLNAASQKEVDALKLEVASLRRKADELGHADGFETYKHSASVSRDADKIEYDISQREIELDYTLTPEHKLAGSQLKQLQEMTESVQAALDLLKTFSQTSGTAVKEIRDRIASYTSDITKGLDAIDRSTTEFLKPAYDEAFDTLEKAAKQVESSTRPPAKGDDVQAARLLAARIHESRGNAYWSQARGAADHVALMTSLGNAGVGNFGNALTAATAAQTEAITQAKAEYVTAQEMLGQVQNRENQAAVDGYKANLERASDALNGKMPEAPTEAAAASSVSSADPAAPKGAASPEELVDAFKSLKGVQNLGRVADLMIPMKEVTGLTPAMRKFGENVKVMMIGLSSLENALQDKFKKGLGDMAPAGGGGGFDKFPKVKDAVLEKVEGTHGTIMLTMEDGAQHQTTIAQISGRWFIGSEHDAIEGIASLMGMGAMAGGSGSDPQAQQMAQAFMQGFAQMFGVMGKAFQDLARDVAAGKFASIEEFKTKSEATMTELMKKSTPPGMSGFPGATGGGKGRPPG